MNWDWSERFIFYAESKDGIHWETPVLGKVKYQGSRENNIIPRDLSRPY